MRSIADWWNGPCLVLGVLLWADLKYLMLAISTATSGLLLVWDRMVVLYRSCMVLDLLRTCCAQVAPLEGTN